MAEKENPCDENFSLLCTKEMTKFVPSMQDIYDKRIKAIERNQNLSENQKLKNKIHALEAYVDLLCEENHEFSTAVLVMEIECYRRVDEMERKLKKTAKSTKEAVINMHEYEKQTKRLVEERLYIESLYKDVSRLFNVLKSENSFLQDQNSNLRHDVQSLLQVIQHARSTGHWELDCVTFCDLSPELVFGPIQSISQGNLDCVIQSYYSETNKGNANFSPVSLYSSHLLRCASLPEIGNIYNIDQAMHKSNSYNSNGKQRLLDVKCSKRTRTITTVQTPELLKVGTCVKIPEERLYSSRSQSEPHLFMFDGHIYKYTPCEPFQKPLSNALNDNCQSSFPAYQSIDLRFPTEGSTLNIDVWNKLKSGAYLDDQENSLSKDSSLDSSLSFEHDFTSVGAHMDSRRSSDISSIPVRQTSTTAGEEHSNDLMEMFEKMINEKDRIIKELELKLQEANHNQEKSTLLVDEMNKDHENLRGNYKKACNEIEELKTQIHNQSDVIVALQESLVQTKRALESALPKTSAASGKKPKSRITNI